MSEGEGYLPSPVKRKPMLPPGSFQRIISESMEEQIYADEEEKKEEAPPVEKEHDDR